VRSRLVRYRGGPSRYVTAPNVTLSPGLTSTSSRTRQPLTNVPLAERRSRRSQAPSEAVVSRGAATRWDRRLHSHNRATGRTSRRQRWEAQGVERARRATPLPDAPPAQTRRAPPPSTPGRATDASGGLPPTRRAAPDYARRRPRQGGRRRSRVRDGPRAGRDAAGPQHSRARRPTADRSPASEDQRSQHHLPTVLYDRRAFPDRARPDKRTYRATRPQWSPEAWHETLGSVHAWRGRVRYDFRRAPRRAHAGLSRVDPAT
jgi:hypothetical protein